MNKDPIILKELCISLEYHLQMDQDLWMCRTVTLISCCKNPPHFRQNQITFSPVDYTVWRKYMLISSVLWTSRYCKMQGRRKGFCPHHCFITSSKNLYTVSWINKNSILLLLLLYFREMLVHFGKFNYLRCVHQHFRLKSPTNSYYKLNSKTAKWLGHRLIL